MDAVMGLNFFVDFLLLLGTDQLAGFPCRWKRTAMAAAVGALYSGVCLLPDFRFLGNSVWRVVSLGLMAGIAFGWNRSTLRRSAVFILLAMALGGLALSFGREDYPVLIGCALGVWGLCRLAFCGGIGQREYIPLEIRHGGKCVSLIALRDTGNLLRDPVTGQQVLVISAETAEQLTGLSLQQLQNPLQTMAHRPVAGLRLIPFRAVGQGCGMLLGMRFQDVRIESKHGSMVVAFDTGGLGKGDIYQALAGGAI